MLQVSPEETNRDRHHSFLLLPHVAELRKTEAVGQGEMSPATNVETLVMGGLKGHEPVAAF